MKRRICMMLGAAAVVGLLATVVQAVNIELVPVGNAGNSADTRYVTPGYGSVAYPYWIGKYEVTAGQYTEFLNAVAKTDTYGLYKEAMWGDYGCKIERSGTLGNYTYNVASDYANRPVNYISFWDACRFTNWLHNGQPTGLQGPDTTETGAYINIGNQGTFTRQPGAKYFIPTENEWYKAAYYDPNKGGVDVPGYWDYPTRSDTTPSNQMTNPDPGNRANFYNNGYTIGSPYWRTVVGEFENSASAYGTFDQGGNLWEWNETAIDGLTFGLRGGYWSSNYNELRASCRGNGDPANGDWYYHVGFRVAGVPEPGSISLLLCGAVAGLLWWRRRS